MNNGWIGVDLDGTLAEYHGWVDGGGIGKPISMMVERVKGWIEQGVEVRIVTARAYNYRSTTVPPELDLEQVSIIQNWTEKHIGKRLPVQFWKDYGMIELWDDRAKQVIPNTGILVE